MTNYFDFLSPNKGMLTSTEIGKNDHLTTTRRARMMM